MSRFGVHTLACVGVASDTIEYIPEKIKFASDTPILLNNLAYAKIAYVEIVN